MDSSSLDTCIVKMMQYDAIGRTADATDMTADGTIMTHV